MAQGVKRELLQWFEDSVEDFQRWEEERILRRVKNMYLKHGPEVEKKIFKYLTRYVMARVNPPEFIEGLPVDYPEWEPLNKNYARKKGTNKKFIYSGRLIAYLSGKEDAQPWYKKPQVKIDYKNKTVTYYSMFREGRKAFKATDPVKETVLQEQKIQHASSGNIEEIDGDNPQRPLVKPMEDFLLYKKLSQIMDEELQRFMEEDYENEQFIPTASQF